MVGSVGKLTGDWEPFRLLVNKRPMNKDYRVVLTLTFSYDDVGAQSVDEAVREAKIRALDQLEKLVKEGKIEFSVLSAYLNTSNG